MTQTATKKLMLFFPRWESEEPILYHLVKDHRTGFEQGNTQAVLDGEITGFIEAFLKN